ncbi:MAG TPA: SRPBCC domain-containing protein [Hyphomicrobiaceae bacterium]|nr:SRPBCC domain-containing protein [Hyphomicrobiaceae bacterium]
MRTIHTEIGILASAEKVWSILIDTGQWAAWNPFATVSGRFAVGERVAVTLTPPGQRAMTFTPTIVHLEPGRELRWLGHLGMPGLFDGEHGFRVLPEDAGRCRFEQFETFRGLLVAPIFWMVGASTKAGFAAMNSALKARAEGSP